jgi:hypothetical protein
MRFVSKPESVSAVQWQPDPQYGEWRSGKIVRYFRSFKSGVGDDGIIYSSAGTYLNTHPASPIEPGNWIVTYENGRREVFTDIAFRSRFDPVNDNAEKSGTLQGPAH